MVTRRLEPERVAQRVQEGRCRSLPHTHGAVALHVGVPADAAGARARLRHRPAQEQQVQHLLDVARSVVVLGDTEAPTNDDALGVPRPLGGEPDLRASDSRHPLDRVPGCGADVVEQRFDAGGIRPDEVPRDRRVRLGILRFDQRFENAFEQRNVAIDPDLKEQVGELRAHAEQTQWLLRVHESYQACLRQRVHCHDLASGAFRLL